MQIFLFLEANTDDFNAKRPTLFPSSQYLIIITGVKHQPVDKSKGDFQRGFRDGSLEGDVPTFEKAPWMQRSFYKQ
jgi:hypothetical protein